MDIKTLLEARGNLELMIAEGKLHDAFSMLMGFSESMMMWDISERIKIAEANYRYMLGYAVNGSADNTRSDFIEGISEQLFGFLDSIILHKKVSDNSYDLLASNIRRQSLASDKLADKLSSYVHDISKLLKSGDTLAIENLERDIFNYIWSSSVISREEWTVLENLIYSDESTDSVKNLIIAGILIRTLSVGYNTDCLISLLDIYNNSRNRILTVRSLTAALLIIMSYSGRIPNGKLNRKFEEIYDAHKGRFTEDIKAVLIELIRTKETERINRKMHDDIMPNMMKMGPKIKERFKGLDEEDLLNLEENPEWKNLFEQSGFADSLMELNKLQMEGADVMMSTFGHLKTFPFFNEAHNWFIPFSASHSSVAGTVRKNDPIVSILSSSGMICDSDAFSFLFSLSRIPEMQRRVLSANIGDQFKAFEEMAGKEINMEDVRVSSNLYIKNLYRFFNLFRRKDEFIDPFKNIKNPVDLHIVCKYIDDKETMKLFAGQYFYLEEWEDALKIYKHLEERGEVTPSIYQKMGFCCQKEGDFSLAYTYYLQADLLDPDNMWTLKKLAFCARKLQKWSTAIDFYKKLNELRPDDLKTVMALGHCLMENCDYKEASNIYFKAYYMDPESESVVFALANSLFMNDSQEEAFVMIDKIKDSKNPDVRILLGNLYFLKGDCPKALAMYKEAYQLLANDRTALLDKISKDRHVLSRSDKYSVFHQVLEQLQYELDEI